MVFSYLDQETLPHKKIVYCRDYKTGLKAIIAVHNTNLGPSLGGCRMYPYKSEKDALEDVLNLSRAMSYKSAFANLNLGGGKSVIIADPETEKTPDLLRSFGRFVESLSGDYIVAKDMNITDKDLQYIGESTSCVVGLPKEVGGAGSPSYATARGVFYGLQAGLEIKLKKDSFKGVKITIQGVGSVGEELMNMVLEEGAEVNIYDVKEEKVKQIKEKHPSVTVLKEDEIFTTPCDIFSPCAMGGAINDKTLKKLKCSIVAGAANNQLSDASIAQKLFDKGILYMPDFIINSGGLIYVYAFLDPQRSMEWIETKLEGIKDSLKEIALASKEKNISTRDAALQLATQKIESVKPDHKNQKKVKIYG